MDPITSKEFNQHKLTLGIYERARLSREVNNLMVLCSRIEDDTNLGYYVEDLDLFTKHIQFSGRWGFIHRTHCARSISDDIVPLIHKLRFNEIYYSHYITTELPICFLIVRANPTHCYLLIHDLTANIICYGSIDVEKLVFNTTIYFDELPLLVPESEVPLFMSAFTKDYGLQQ